jgi:predicted NBD/HSP70 family sugar kinase
MDDQDSIRVTNAARVLAALRRDGPSTATDLMAGTRLSRPTVHAVCQELIDLGWVRELEPVRSNGRGRPGRSARQYAFDARCGYVLGVDVGAAKVTVVATDLQGEIVAESVQVFDDVLLHAEQRLAQTSATIDQALRRGGIDRASVLAVGLGVPGPVDRERGTTTAIDAFLPGLAGLDLRASIHPDPGWDVQVENDANLAVLGERWRGVADGVENVVMVLAGERLGAGIVLDGRLIRGHHGGAGELSMLFLVEGVGDTDGIASVARQLGEQAVAAGWALPEGAPISAASVFAAARDGDAVARGIVAELAERFARVVAAIDTLYDPELIVIGGAVAAAGDVVLEPIRSRLPATRKRLGVHPTGSPVRLEASTLGDHAVVTGAVRFALDRIQTVMLGGGGKAIQPAPPRPGGAGATD